MPTEEGSTAGKGKESMVLTDGSLAILAREIGGAGVSGLVLCMYLNIPNTTIVNATNEASECGLLGVSDVLVIEATQRLLLQWKTLRAGSKDKDKVKDLERALKEMGKPEFADVINDKHANNLELTSEFFQNL
ncbi:uncharacterized protein LOC132742430 isoform X2 [Ruditapes philippinarum]|uniref:uncharacterized protein LOC132742430 isoform X2 n=1 Tax=Ruditapes philippinarum TaxID=129788 RepID=UPI00295AFB3F|nr:uncharacterized protein LOC132742430 isoform X2 [Ruditapes philippinarum]